MNEISRTTAVLALQGLLAVGALHGVAAAAEPAARQVGASALERAPVSALMSDYLRCDRLASRQRLPTEAAAYCIAVGDELLKREFDGDFDRLVAWWRGARQAPASE